MATDFRLILIAFCCCLQSIKGLNQATHAALSQQGNVTCEKHDFEFTLIFDLVLNGDELGIIYLLNNTDFLDNTASSYSSASGDILGDGTNSNPFRVNITATKSAVGFDFTTGDDYLKRGYVIAGDSLGLVVMVKSVYNAPFFDKAHFPNDVIYRASCNYSDTEDLVVTSGSLTVNGENNENSDVVYEQASLQVLDAKTRTVATSVNLGDSILFQLQVLSPTFAVGIYGKGCSFCDNQFCNGTFSIEFIKPNGCSTLSRVSNFKHTSKGISETEAFKAFVFNGDPNLFVQCRAHLCYTPGDPKCTDYCQFNSRKKRQVTFIGETEDVVLSVGLTVLLPKSDTGNGSTIIVNLDDPFGIGSAATNRRKAEAEKTKAAQSMNNTMVSAFGGVVAFAGLVSVGVGVACYLKQHRNTKSFLNL